MPYVERDVQGNIVATFSRPQKERTVEFVQDDDAGLLAYNNPPLTQGELITEALAGTEDVAQVARKVEDLIDYIVNGTPLDPALEAWRADRATKRANV